MKRMMNFFLPAVLAAALSLPGGCGRKEPPGAVVNITGPEGLSVGCGKQVFTKPPFELKMPPGSGPASNGPTTWFPVSGS